MDPKLDNFWTSFGTTLEPILETKTHQKMDKKKDPFWTKKSSPGSVYRRLPAGDGGAPGPPIATGSELIRAKKYRKPIGLLSTGILSTTEYYRHTEYTGILSTTEYYKHTEYY